MAGADRRPRYGWALRWRSPLEHRCSACGRWVGLGAEAGHGWGRPLCEPCHLSRERRLADVRALAALRSLALSGAA